METLADQISDIYYANLSEIVNRINEDLKQINPRFSASTDTHTGCICIEDEKTENASIFATPFYEGEQNIPIDISFWDGGNADEQHHVSLAISDEEISWMKSEGANKVVFLCNLYKNYIPVIIAIYEAKRKALLLPEPAIIS